MERTIVQRLCEDVREKMVFLGGPRQVGKTTVATQVLAREGAERGLYLSWDRKADRQVALAGDWPPPPALVVLDEFHKLRGWKRWIKGEHDRHGLHVRFLLTGSARLDVYRRGGDSLQGRYHHHRLHPISAAEAEGRTVAPEPGQPLELAGAARPETIDALVRFGGFPEPFLAASERVHRRWQKERLDRFFREDVRDLERVSDLASLEHLADMLPRRVGSPLSLESLRGDLDVSHKTVTRWMLVLERLYHVHRITPYTPRLERGLKKQAKAYLWDSSLVADEGARFENLVAAHLLKLVHALEDRDGHRAALHYMRDKDGREVDFLVTHDNRPWFAVEAKLDDEEPHAGLRYFGPRLHIPQLFQVVLRGRREFVRDGIHVVPAARFLASLP